MISNLWDFFGPGDKERKDEGGDSCGERNQEVFPSQCFLSNQNLTLERVLFCKSSLFALQFTLPRHIMESTFVSKMKKHFFVLALRKKICGQKRHPPTLGIGSVGFQYFIQPNGSCSKGHITRHKTIVRTGLTQRNILWRPTNHRPVTKVPALGELGKLV